MRNFRGIVNVKKKCEKFHKKSFFVHLIVEAETLMVFTKKEFAKFLIVLGFFASFYFAKKFAKGE